MECNFGLVSFPELHFELEFRGGKYKGKKQIANTANAYVVKDDIEYGTLNVVPLWHFGLLY